MAKLPIVNCRQCGRDTAARDEICARCRGGRFQPGEEGAGRKGRRAMESLDAMDPAEDESPTRSQYHGDSIRDDI